MDAIFNDKDEVHPVNMPNAGGALPGFPDDLVVEVLGRCHARRHRRASRAAAAAPRPGPRRDARRVPGARRGDRLERHRHDGIRALAANPLVRQVELAERLYDALATAHRAYLPDRLLPPRTPA